MTLESIKDCLAFEKGSGLHRSLSSLCDAWFAIDKKNGASDADAAKVVMDKLGAELLELSKSVK